MFSVVFASRKRFSVVLAKECFFFCPFGSVACSVHAKCCGDESYPRRVNGQPRDRQKQINGQASGITVPLLRYILMHINRKRLHGLVVCFFYVKSNRSKSRIDAIKKLF
ncbi:hypothetical protein FE839_06420 [Klebsiella indica]|uniref:Uncharacterized protein n=1 Tax=Klebsiella indica TaxID=2582917 RepID=A0A5R9LLP4_9ENTR|nr:hypothetical protein FE839_06420 [Klebsiella indica]